MLVVVGAVDDVVVSAVDEIVVAEMGNPRVTAVRPVDVHVAEVLDVDRGSRPILEFVDMASVGMVDVAIVHEVEMVVVRDHGVSAQPVMLVRVLGGGTVDGDVSHGLLAPR